MRKFRNTIHRMKEKACRFIYLMITKVPVAETIIALSVLIILLLIFRPLIVKYIGDIIFR